MNKQINMNELDFADSLVAFIDILGFKNFVKQDTQTALKILNKIDGHLSHVLKVLRDEHSDVISIKLFSDCLCLSSQYSIENLFTMLYEIAYIQLLFASDGVFFRGALSRGHHFENNSIIFSKGLVKAYEIEQIAKTPRVVIDPELLEEILEDNNEYYPIYVGFKKREFVIKNTDGYNSVDYLSILGEEGIEQNEFCRWHKREILTAIENNNHDPNIVEKFRWLAEYHNYKVTDIFDEGEWTDDYTSRLTIDVYSTFPQFEKY